MCSTLEAMTKAEREELDKSVPSAGRGIAVVDEYGVSDYIQEPEELWEWLKSYDLVVRKSFGESHIPRRFCKPLRLLLFGTTTYPLIFSQL